MLFFSTITLYILVDLFSVSLIIATFLCAEIALLIRFLVNQKIIFRVSGGGLIRPLIKFHAASASAFIVWWGVTNLLAYMNIYYIYASILAVGFSSGINFLTNFLWIWKNETKLK